MYLSGPRRNHRIIFFMATQILDIFDIRKRSAAIVLLLLDTRHLPGNAAMVLPLAEAKCPSRGSVRKRIKGKKEGARCDSVSP